MRDRCAAHMRLGICGFMGLLALAADPVRAQQQGTLRGVVVDSAGAPIKDVDVGIVGHRRLMRTDDSGRFAFANLPVGAVELSVRRLSYEPRRVQLDVTTSLLASSLVVMTANPAFLDAVDVSAATMRRREGIEEFHRRRVRGVGSFIDREQIEARHGGLASDVLRNTPGIRFVRTASGRGVRFPTTSIARRDCPPMLWLDGQKAPGMEIDDVPLQDIEGVELYHGASTTPLQFSQAISSASCGTIVIWTRSPTPRR